MLFNGFIFLIYYIPKVTYSPIRMLISICIFTPVITIAPKCSRTSLACLTFNRAFYETNTSWHAILHYFFKQYNSTCYDNELIGEIPAFLHTSFQLS